MVDLLPSSYRTNTGDNNSNFDIGLKNQKDMSANLLKVLSIDMKATTTVSVVFSNLSPTLCQCAMCMHAVDLCNLCKNAYHLFNIINLASILVVRINNH